MRVSPATKGSELKQLVRIFAINNDVFSGKSYRKNTRCTVCTVRGELSAFVVMLKHSSDITQLRGFTDVKPNCEALAIPLTRPNVLLAFFTRIIIKITISLNFFGL